MAMRRRSESKLSLVNLKAVPRQFLPPITQETEGEPPFYRQDLFSDAVIATSERKLWTSRCLLAYNSPVFEKILLSARKQHEIDMRAKPLEDVVELLSYLDPRVQYTVSADSAKKLLPFAEEYEMFKLRRSCEIVLQKTFEGIRKEYETGKIPSEITEEYLILSDKYGLQKLLQMCVQEVGKAPTNGLPSRNIIELESLSEQVKLLILEQRLATLSSQLQKERRERNSAEQRLGDTASGTARWRYVGPTQNNYYHQW